MSYEFPVLRVPASGRNPVVERIRKAVGNRLRDTLGRIREAHPALGEHLSATIKTGVFCSYDPPAAVTWEA